MRQLDQIAQALIGALGFSTKRDVARIKLLCRGSDSAAGETVLILECRVRARSAPVATPNSGGRSKGHGGSGKSAGNSRQKNRRSARAQSGALMQDINNRANENTSGSLQSEDGHLSLDARLPGQLHSGVFTE